MAAPGEAGVGGKKRPERPAGAAGRTREGRSAAEQPERSEGLRPGAAGLAGRAAHPRLDGAGLQQRHRGPAAMTALPDGAAVQQTDCGNAAH